MTTYQSQEYAVHIEDMEGSPIPPKPGPGWTRFVCISDTHSCRYRVPPGDVLLHAGDLSSWGHPTQLETTVEWLKSLRHPVKIIVAGNHDLCLDEKWGQCPYSGGPLELDLIERARAYVRGQAVFGLNYLEYESFTFTAPSGKVWKLYGSPAAPRYALGAFQYASTAQAQAIYDRIPDNTEILITHTPPYEVLDRTRKGKHAGCRTLASRLDTLQHCRLHVFGHIHEAAGARVDRTEWMASSRVSVNAALQRSQRAIVVDLRD